jgi:L-histidine N-alpha-methyltransferase
MTSLTARTILLDKSYDPKADFKKDVLEGLSSKNKRIASKYFYDDKGSIIYNKITQHKDYYLTRCELEIIQSYKKHLAELFSGYSINVIELGPGEGIKTEALLKQFKQEDLDFTYMPIDISLDYLVILEKELPLKIPGIDVCAINADFFNGLQWLQDKADKPNLVLFLGSSIGNLDLAATREFLKSLWSVLNKNDYVFIGFDLRKDLTTLMKAYQDSDLLTSDFNLNLLNRLNSELEANFNLNYFEHYAFYNPMLNAMESYIMSTRSQLVNIRALNKVFYFDHYEGIHVEYSHKYTISQINNLALEAGFRVVQNFTDQKNYFVDSLWQVKK